MRKITLKFMIIWSVFVWVSCSDFLKEESQSEVIPKTTGDFSELLLGTGYPTVNAPHFGIVALMDDDCAQFLTYISKEPDRWVDEAASITVLPIYSWQPYMADFDGFGGEINTSATGSMYASFYRKILGCNAVLDYIDDAVGEEAERNHVKAEALAVRSLLYFQLVNLYGEPYNHNKEALGVPVRISADLVDKPQKRETVGYIYEEVILKGLQEAARLMDPLPIVRKNYRVNQPAIHILLSRVYLYMERYEECIAEVEKAIEQGIRLLDMVNELQVIQNGASYEPITYNNPEVEWLFGPAPVSGGMGYLSGTAPSFRALWDEERDQRWKVNHFQVEKKFNGTTDNSVLMTKPDSYTEYGQSVRSAEAFLNRMEAFVLFGNEKAALAELNAFRKTRIVDYRDESFSGQDLLNEIRLERRKELCFEGHRWFDLRRYGMPEIRHIYKYEKGGEIYEFVLKQGDVMYTLPFPSSVIMNNTALKQNVSRNMEVRQSEILK